MNSDPPAFLIGVVGPCGSGKSTLIKGLEKHGYHCRHIAQEHSYVRTMWQIITKPNLLIFLHSSFEQSTARHNLNWTLSDYEEQQRRLSHAREHADLIIDTDLLDANSVLQKALNFLTTTYVK